MKFEDALNKAYDKVQEKHPELLQNGFLSPEGLLTASVVWNMIAMAQKEKGLDDFVIIRNNNIISFPLGKTEAINDKGKPADDENKLQGEGKSQKPKTATKKDVDVKEKPEKPEPSESESDS